MVNVEDVQAGNYYKLLEPEWATTYNQGEQPDGIKIRFSDKEYLLPWNEVFKASDSCDPEHQIANLSATPYPLLRTEFIKENNTQFEEIITE